ncbi:MAG TPA: helix-turn-helix transcriptional regulator [Clostridiales bacterium]|nr:helix-turn-helix transcriptional regulator [Clostridiales bacterium]
MNLGDKIKELRIERGMKQSDLAERANISRVSVGNYERNDRVPNADILIQISKALNVNPVALLSGTNSTEELDNLINHLKDGFDTVLYNIGYKTEVLKNGCLKLIYPDNKELILQENEYEALKEEINDYIRYVLSKIPNAKDSSSK